MLTSRPDTRSGWSWIARLGPAALLAAGLPLAVPDQLHAQILGQQTPGTPGALDGELRTSSQSPLRIPQSSTRLRGPEADIEGPTASQKFGLKRNSNAAAKRQLGSGQTRNSGFPGASATGGGGVPVSPSSRNSRDLTGARFGNAADANATTPPLGRPTIP